MDNLDKVILEVLHIRPVGRTIGKVLFFCNLLLLILLPVPPLLLKINMLLIIGGMFLMYVRPEWQ